MRAKSQALTELFITRIEALGESGLRLASPRDANARGSHVSLTFARGYELIQALIARGVIGDFRAPDIVRFGFTPLYLRYVDVWDAVTFTGEVLSAGLEAAEPGQRSAVT